jgi:hypothetical protein
VRGLIVASALAIASCGGADDHVAMHLAFKMQALMCPITDLQARLQVQGPGIKGEIDCPLAVASDLTVSGTCPHIPTGGVREFRLEYFVIRNNREVELAYDLQMLDFTTVKTRVVAIDFTDMLTTNIDDDGDGVTNIVEVCTGMDPENPNG